MQNWDAGELAEAGDGPAEGVLAGGDVGVPGDVVARGLVQVKLLAGLDTHLEQGPVFRVEPGEIPVHDPAGIEAVLVGVEGNDAAVLGPNSIETFWLEFWLVLA